MQKYVESLDAIRAKNAASHNKASGNGHAKPRAPHLPPRPPPVSQRRQFQAPPPAAPTTTKTAAAPLPPHGELGVVRPAVLDAVHVVVHRDDHHGRRDDHHHHLADPAVRLGALLARSRSRSPPPPMGTLLYTTLHYTLHLFFVHSSRELIRSVALAPDRSAALAIVSLISSVHSSSSFFFLHVPFFISRVYLQKQKRRNTMGDRVCSVRMSSLKSVHQSNAWSVTQPKKKKLGGIMTKNFPVTLYIYKKKQHVYVIRNTLNFLPVLDHDCLGLIGENGSEILPRKRNDLQSNCNCIIGSVGAELVAQLLLAICAPLRGTEPSGAELR